MINNLELKLSGELPVTREELFKLVSSWGRISNFETTEEIDISFCPKKECYPLENLDVSKIDDLSDIFHASPYNGDLSKWDVSNCIDMSQMFANSHFNNNSIKNWELNSCKKISAMFTSSQFKSIPPDFDFNIIKFADLVFYHEV